MHALPLSCDREVVHDRPSSQVKHFKAGMKRKYINEEAMMKIMDKRTVVTTNSTIIEAKRKTCIKNGRISQYWITQL